MSVPDASPSKRVCSVEQCFEKHSARGFCVHHYRLWKRHGDPLFDAHGDSARFWRKVDKTKTCWLWTGGKNELGYGRFYFDGRIQPPHRISYEWLVGPIPDGLVIDHLCRVPACVNPDHLEPVPQRTNILRGTSPVARRAAQTECKKGHPFSGRNLIQDGSHRKCRICTNEGFRRRRAQRNESP